MVRHVKAKKILLAVLTIIAVYIWWGNLEMFTSTANPSLAEVGTDTTGSQTSQPTGRIEYREPKINPFKREVAEIKSERPQPTRQRTAPTPQQQTLSSKCVLKGLITEKETPQAVVKTETGNSEVLSLGDSLRSWELVRIGDRQVIFRKEKAYDTLWLDGAKP